MNVHVRIPAGTGYGGGHLGFFRSAFTTVRAAFTSRQPRPRGR
ncbi:hypothetical protein SCATT_32490 [Streptantibioticus cattleyicolor NRRL 8057 = DSM 46488]|uniref:Uncharacterized protein n=1 Tax=Streptantibioticus cattleyicolor (strain ATCC 35852 / DSM 46488 / JCM 4925 / NBRC 14057 / NRRL 8057) TaxID=1003195 RepID=G8X2M9_STREN|nr:hypothetical protein SCATT_32490 [Streptantibioticus cattleyicolor NRRL 8057 = DSM 46488]